jgi:hypothetical protein
MARRLLGTLYQRGADDATFNHIYTVNTGYLKSERGLLGSRPSTNSLEHSRRQVDSSNAVANSERDRQFRCSFLLSVTIATSWSIRW